MIDLEKERALIEKTALKNGFKLKQQPNGEMALNPYVFDFAEELLADKQAEITELKQKLSEIAQQEIEATKRELEFATKTINNLLEKLAKYESGDVVVMPRKINHGMHEAMNNNLRGCCGGVCIYEEEAWEEMIKAGEIK